MAALRPSTFHSHSAFRCISVQPLHSQRNTPPPPITGTPAISRLASSLLRQQMHSPQGQALMALTNQNLPPSLISLSASQHLELLAAMSSSVTSAETHEDILHRLIAEVNERKKEEAVQEIVFVLVASKLLQATRGSPHLHGRDAALAIQWPCLDDVLQKIHAPEVRPLTSRHVAMVINGKRHVEDPVQEPNRFGHVGKFELGKMYAASVMHGYALARVHQRFKLEQRLQLAEVEPRPMEASNYTSEEAVSIESYLAGDAFQDEAAIRRVNSLSCRLSLNVIEHHCQAMFGPIPCHRHRNDTTVSVRIGFVRSLMYQALAFGALLWDVEHNFVPMFYPHICQEDY